MRHAVVLVICVPIVWIGFEYLRSNVATGFPWNALGISQYRNPAVIQVATWGGVYAVSFLAMMLNTALTVALLDVLTRRERRRRAWIHLELALAFTVCLIFWVRGAWVVRGRRIDMGEREKLRVAAIQPNVPQLKKWPDTFADEIMLRLERLTDTVAASHPDLIIWPETAVPGDVLRNERVQALIYHATRHGVPVLAGLMEVTPHWRQGLPEGDSPGSGDIPESPVSYTLYNSSVLYGSEGRMLDRYRKQHLVPFGEYIPMEKRIPVLRRLAPLGFSCESGIRQTVFSVQAKSRDGPAKGTLGEKTPIPVSTAPFSVLICFEDVFAYLARDAVRHGARLLVNQTNDAWFDGSSGPVQHLSHSVFRCVENRVPMVRAANTGVTCFIDRMGVLDPVTRGLLEADEWTEVEFRVSGVSVAEGKLPQTLYARYGDRIFAAPCGLAALALLAMVCGPSMLSTLASSRRISQNPPTPD